MATVVLSVAGALLGGPPGAQLGAQLGGVIDSALLFKPGRREGARLGDLRVQTSSYGTAIPRLFGSIRVAGCVIWATDLIEHRGNQSGGKGQPSTTTYSYTASFAVALSARPILQLGRIWADGQLLRGAAGDFKVRTGFRLYTGDEDQPVEPLIAAIEGAGRAPAHRGLAYAVFEDLELATFGNRIPQLSFEVIADEAPVPVAGIAQEIAGLSADGVGTLLTGFSAQDTVRTALDALCTASGAWLREESGALAMVAGGGEAVTIPDDGCGAGGERGARRVRALAALDGTPRRLSVGYFDPARDYQAGVQQAHRPGLGTREARVDLPAVLDASTAKAIAADALARADRTRERRTLTLGWNALGIAPGARIAIEGVAGQWRVERWALEKMVVRLDCVPVAEAPLTVAASAGRAVASPDMRRGRSLLVPFELPMLDDAPATAPQMMVAAAGTGSGWRRAALLASADGGSSWAAAGDTAYPAVLGTVHLAPGPARAALADHAGFAEVDLAHEGMLLLSADDAGLDAGTNLALLGGELLQFGAAEHLGGTRWRLSRLWRGRRGTEAAIGRARPGDPFVLVERDCLKSLALAVPVGGSIAVLAQGVDDPPDAVPAVAAARGIAVLPLAPVHLTATAVAGGTLVSWVRRSRAGWTWRDGVDVPLAEERERYQVDIASDTGSRSVTTDTASLLLPAGAPDLPLRIGVRQIGTHGPSPETGLLLPAHGDRA